MKKLLLITLTLFTATTMHQATQCAASSSSSTTRENASRLQGATLPDPGESLEDYPSEFASAPNLNTDKLPDYARQVGEQIQANNLNLAIKAYDTFRLLYNQAHDGPALTNKDLFAALLSNITDPNIKALLEQQKDEFVRKYDQALRNQNIRKYLNNFDNLQDIAMRKYVKDLLDTRLKTKLKNVENELNNVFASQNTFLRYAESIGIPTIFATLYLPSVARAYYLHLKGDMKEMPKWLEDYFYGVSIQDLIDNNLMPSILHPELNLEKKNILSLNGLQQIPGIAEVRTLHLNHNNLTNLQPGNIANLPKLEWLYLAHNNLTNLQPGSIANLPMLQLLRLDHNNLSEEARRRIEAEIRTMSPNVVTGPMQMAE